MIFIYTEGGKKLGLGHLSRVIPIYNYLIKNDYKIKVILYGDELGIAYLDVNQIPFIISKDFIKNNTIQHDKDIWIVDSTDIYEEEILIILKKSSGSNILLSPKFKTSKCKYFVSCILRSDPFNLPMEKKFVSPYYLSYNKAKYELDNNMFIIGIALSGGANNAILNKLVNKIINDPKLNSKVWKLQVFMGGSNHLEFERKSRESYEVDIEFISSLKSLWNYTNDVDLMIVGNGILVDECIFEQKPFFIFNPDENNKLIIKSDFIKNSNEKYVIDFNNITGKMSGYLNQNKEKSLNDISKPILNNMYLDKIITEIS